jgi:transposase-like protein
MSAWDALIVQARWPRCGHIKTLENTYRAAGQSAKCLTCKRNYSLEYFNRRKLPIPPGTGKRGKDKIKRKPGSGMR